jgi:hypothetical protein
MNADKTTATEDTGLKPGTTRIQSACPNALLDPLGFDTPLPLSACFYPMGFPLVLETNCAEILRLAGSLWSRWKARNTARPARFRIAVSDEPSIFPLTPVMPRGQQHLISIIHSAENFGMCDVLQSFAYVAVTRDVAMDVEYFRYHFLEILAYGMIDAAHLAPLHASCVAWGNKAVVLCGESGAGKTSLAYACARHGWTYLSDDATHVVRDRAVPWVAGRPFRIRFRESARELFPELRRFTPKRRPNGKLDIEVETEELNISVSTENPASHMVFLNRSSSIKRANIDEYAVDQASARVQRLVCYGDERIRHEQDVAIRNLLQLPVRRLTYSDTDSAEHALRELVESSGSL